MTEAYPVIGRKLIRYLINMLMISADFWKHFPSKYTIWEYDVQKLDYLQYYNIYLLKQMSDEAFEQNHLNDITGGIRDFKS